MPVPGEKQRLSWLMVVALAVLSTGLVVGRLDSQERPRPYVTREPPASLDSMSPDALTAYIRSLRFDPDPWAGDEQRLLIGRFVVDSPQLARYGPLVRIEPEEGEQHLSYPQLRRGRIVARFVNRDTTPYPKLGLVGHGVTYWWIEGPYQQDSGRAENAWNVCGGAELGPARAGRARTTAGHGWGPHGPAARSLADAGLARPGGRAHRRPAAQGRRALR